MVNIARCGCVAGCACIIHTVDSECIDLNIEGSGTDLDRYLISADLKVDPTNTCLSCGALGLTMNFDPSSSDSLNCGPSGLRLILDPNTNNLLSFTGNGLLADASAELGAANENLAVFERTAALEVTTGESKFRFPFNATIIGISAALGSPATGSSVIFDVNKNGTTIFTTQANRPTISASSVSIGETVPDVTAMATGDYLTVDIDQIGSGDTGSDATVFIRYRREA